MKALVGAFNQEKALVGAFSVIVQLCLLFVCSTSKVARCLIITTYSGDRNVQTKYGPVQGVLQQPADHLQPVATFLGIPFATPPLGNLRSATIR